MKFNHEAFIDFVFAMVFGVAIGGLVVALILL